MIRIENGHSYCSILIKHSPKIDQRQASSCSLKDLFQCTFKCWLVDIGNSDSMFKLYDTLNFLCTSFPIRMITTIQERTRQQSVFSGLFYSVRKSYIVLF